jgi:hypothetical protein
MFTSLERRMICMNCELKVVGNTFTMLEQPLVPRKETDLNVPPMGNVSINILTNNSIFLDYVHTCLPSIENPFFSIFFAILY